MNKKTLIILTFLTLLLLFFLSVLVWGKTMRAARANRILENPAEPDGTAKARQVYEDLLVDLPRSPYLLHNLGLALYREDRPEDAAVRFHLAREELANLDMNLTQRRNLAHKFHYHLGGALFTAAETSNDEEAVTGYQKALEEFKQAVKMDPADSDAKYNYELTLLRLERAKSEKNQEKEEQQKKEEGQYNKENPSDKEHNNENHDTDTHAESPAEKKDEDSGMTEEEALKLLETVESGALYQGPLFPDTPSTGKDW